MSTFSVKLSRLQAQLQTSGLQKRDNATYQVINQLISSLSDLVGFINIPSNTSGENSSSITPNSVISIPGFDGLDGADSIPIPGSIGPQGVPGSTGPHGLIGIPTEDGLDGDFFIALPGPQGNPGIQGPTSPWSLISSYSPTNDASKDFTGLSAYTDIRVFLKQITLIGSAGLVRMRVSIDNGVTFLSSSGDYVGISTSTGVETNKDALDFFDQTFTTARSSEFEINGFNLTAPKVGWTQNLLNNTDFTSLRYIPTANALNAIRILSTGSNMNSGTIYVFGR